MSDQQQLRTIECKYEDCPKSWKYDPDDGLDETIAEENAESHFEIDHGGRARVQVVVEKRITVQPGMDVQKHVDDELDSFEEDYSIGRYRPAFARHEIIEEPDELPEDDDAE